MGVGLPKSDPPLSAQITKGIQTELRKELRRLAQKYETKDKEYKAKDEEMSKIKDKISEVTLLNQTLLRSLGFKKNKEVSIDEELKEYSDKISSYLNVIDEKEPDHGWHVGRVLVGRAANRFPDHYDIKNYVMSQSPSRIAHDYLKMFCIIDRYERELDKYDSNLNNWAKQIICGSPSASLPWATMFDCPKGGRCQLPWVDKLIKEHEPMKVSGPAKPTEAYPKIKV